MIRSSIGKWLLTGDELPKDLSDDVQEIGKALEEESSRLRDRTSESIPGEKNMR
jgi:hypothetical protein